MGVELLIAFMLAGGMGLSLISFPFLCYYGGTLWMIQIGLLGVNGRYERPKGGFHLAHYDPATKHLRRRRNQWLACAIASFMFIVGSFAAAFVADYLRLPS